MTDRNETLADIVAEMRASPLTWLSPEGIPQMGKDNEALANFSDRIEAAWKKERSILVADAENAKDARNRVEIKLRQEFADKCKERASKVGNAAKLREALKSAHFFLVNLDADLTEVPEQIDELCEVQERIEAALASPPRNCDRFASFDEAITAFAKEAKISIPWDAEKYARLAMWLFAQAAQEGGV